MSKKISERATLTKRIGDNWLVVHAHKKNNVSQRTYIVQYSSYLSDNICYYTEDNKHMYHFKKKYDAYETAKQLKSCGHKNVFVLEVKTK